MYTCMPQNLHIAVVGQYIQAWPLLYFWSTIRYGAYCMQIIQFYFHTYLCAHYFSPHVLTLRASRANSVHKHWCNYDLHGLDVKCFFLICAITRNEAFSNKMIRVFLLTFSCTGECTKFDNSTGIIEWVGDGYCNLINNNELYGYDGGKDPFNSKNSPLLVYTWEIAMHRSRTAPQWQSASIRRTGGLPLGFCFLPRTSVEMFYLMPWR